MGKEKKVGTTLCKDIAEQRLTSDRQRIDKESGEQGMAVFLRYIQDQADGWCENGLCSSGTCKGHRKDESATILNETDDYVEVKYTSTIYCECG